MAIYDDQDKQPKKRTREFSSHDLLDEERGSLAKSGGESPGSTSTPEQLRETESNIGQTGTDQHQPNDTLGKGFTGSSSTTGKKKVSRTKQLIRFFASRGNRKTLALVGGGGSGVLIIVVVVLVALIPLKIESIIDDLESHFFSSTENAIENESDNILKNYFSKYVGPVLKQGCGSTINKDCRVVVSSSSNPVLNLYHTFSQEKLEYTLAEKYGIELSYVETDHGGTYYLKAPGTIDTSVDGEAVSKAGDNTINSTMLGDAMDRTEVRSTINAAIKSDSHWENVLMRFKVGRLLEEKYGIKRCLVFCGVKDAFTNASSNAKYAFKSLLLERVITPRSASLGAVLDCLLNNSCNTQQQSPCAEGTDCGELSNAPTDSEEEAVSAALESSSSGFGSETADSLINAITAARDSGTSISNYLIQQAVNKIFGTDISEDSIPAVGQFLMIDQASNLLGSASGAGSSLKKASYLVDAAAAVSLYMMYRTFSDEMKTGHDSAAEVGSFTSALGSGDQCVKSLEGSCPSQPVNGMASAEQTPLYASLIDGQSSSSPAPSSTADLSLLGTAYAAGASGAAKSVSAYLCDDGNPVPTGSLVCPEEHLGGSNQYVSDVSNFLSSSGLAGLAGAFNSSIVGKGLSYANGLIGNIIGGVLSGAETLLEHLPGTSWIVSSIKGAITDGMSSFFDFLINKLVPSPFSIDESGGRTYDEVAAGADAAGASYGQNGIGGERLSSKDVATIDNQQTKEAEEEFKQEPFFARMFDTTTPYSLISRLAMDMPIGSKRSITQQAASAIISNPFTGLLHGLASVFNRSDSVFATSSALVNDPFGVTQYGYPDAAASIPSDPETYWDQNCTNGTALQQYNNQAASQTDDNGLPLNTSPDPCLLIQATVGSVGGYYDSSLLSSDDLADSNSNGSTTTTTTPTASNSNYYQIGDSLSVGMAASGLASDLAKGNWDISKIEANTGYTIEASEPLLQTDQSDISNAGIIVVELGTNDIYETQAQIVSDIQNMVSAIKTVNSTAQIDWVNTYSTLLPGYKTVNAAISQEATSLGYTVLDWASEAINNPSLYDFNSSDGLGVHQATGAGYQAMSNWLAGQIGEAPSSQSSDIVRNLLNSPSSPSLTSKFANVLKGFDNLFTPPVKLKGLAESK